MSRVWLPRCVSSCLTTTTPSRSAFPSLRLVTHRAFALPSRWGDAASVDIFSDDFLIETSETPFVDGNTEDLRRTKWLMRIRDADSDDEDGALDAPKEDAFAQQGQEEGRREQITPSITVEWRPLIPNKRIRHRSKGPDPWQVNAQHHVPILDVTYA